MKKIFIIGNPRSGTTLVQKLIGNHEDIYTCKETHYFQKIRPRKKREFLSRLLLSQSNFKEAYQFIQDNIQLLGNYESCKVSNFQDAVKFFDHLMTSEAKLRGKIGWLEKTPGHLFHIDLITRYIANTQFIHVIRDGRDVIASLVDAARKYPEARVWERYLNIKGSVDNYNKFIKESLKYIGVKGHFFVSYDQIIENAKTISKTLFSMIDMSITENTTLKTQDIHENIVRGDEPWKNYSVDKIEDTRLVKFNKIFSKEEKELIIRNLNPLPRFNKII